MPPLKTTPCLLSGPGAGYDLERLVQQLQQQGPTATLESPLDRLVDERIQLQLNGLFTATGKVKHGVAGKRHRLISHNAKYIRQNRGTDVLAKSDTARVHAWAPYGLK